MRLTLHTDFALRVLIQVGLNDGKLTTIKDIARTFDISKTHLMKVVNDLSQKGYLDTVRGRGGGIRLMRAPRNINVGQVVRDTENRLDVIGCLEHKGYCPIERGHRHRQKRLGCITQGAAEHAEAEGFLFSDFNRSDDNTRCGVIKSAKVCILAPLIFGRGK